MAPLRTLAALLVCLGSASAFAPVTSTVSRQAVATPRYVLDVELTQYSYLVVSMVVEAVSEQLLLVCQ